MEQRHKWAKEIIAWLNGKEVMGRRSSSGAWQVVLPDDFRYFNDLDCEFRIAPKTILINGFEVPEPCREKLKYGTNYFYTYFGHINHFSSPNWKDDLVDFHRLKMGFVHLTEEAAIAHAEALLSFTSEEK